MMQPRAAEGFALPPAFLLLFRYRQTLLLQSAFQNKRVSLSNTQKVSKGKSRDLFANRVESFFDGMYSRFSTCFTERALSSFVEIRCIKKFGKNANLGCSENRFFFLPFFHRKKYELEKSVPPRTRERERERERLKCCCCCSCSCCVSSRWYILHVLLVMLLFLEQNQVLFPRAVVHGSGTFHGS
jgi:hypothetical protein